MDAAVKSTGCSSTVTAVPPLGELLLFGDISIPGQDRMDNLLKVHI